MKWMSTDFTNSAKALWVTLSLLTKVLGSAKIETPKSTISMENTPKPQGS